MDERILAHRAHPSPADEIVETHYAALERARCPFCYDGWVFLGFEAEDEHGEHVEVVESVPCRRCFASSETLSIEPFRPVYPLLYAIISITAEH